MNSALNQIKLMLKNKIGLDSSTIGDNTIEKIILRRMQLCDMFEFKDYLQLIKHSQQELNELLENTVIPETWFFRDILPYEFIYNEIQKTLLTAPSTHFRILSIPSSTGEEPYSLSMYLIEKGINALTFSIDAVDVSQRALQLAKKAIYGDNSFRGKHYHLYKKKYFTYENSHYVIQPDIRDKIKFYSLNILHRPQSIQHPFDFILCRNLLIYFDVNTKRIAFENLSILLKDNGYLFVGHSEIGSVPDDIFHNSGFEKSFSLIKRSQVILKENESINYKNLPNTHSAKTTTKTSFEKLIHKEDIQPKNKNNNFLEKISKLANASEFSKAKETCLLHIKNNGEDADVLYFLGLIFDSQNNPKDAESYYRKSIYLNPNHYESLINLSLISENNGDSKNADLFKKRAEKSFSQKN